MKRLLLFAALALGTTAANAQTVALSTYLGTDITKYDGLTRNVTLSRQVFTGWNTISLPFDVTTDKLNEVFGEDCRLERLVGVESDGNGIKLNFMDCKEEGMQANVPYILHYTGEMTMKRIRVENAPIVKAPAEVSFRDVNGVEVTFAAAQSKREAKGIYGILAKDNAEAAFVNADHITAGLYATRCYIQLSNGNSTMLRTNHLAAGETTAISSVLRASETADVYSISGTKVASRLDAGAIANLPAGVYVVNGRKVAVK